MPRIFESLVRSNRSTGQPTTQPTTPRVAQVSISELNDIASRAAQRQRDILESSPGTQRSLFPVQEVDGALPSLLASPPQQTALENPPGQRPTASLSPQANGGSQPSSVPQGSPQQSAAPRLTEASFDQLTPTQRQEAYRNVFASQVDAVVDEDGTFQTAESGAPLVAFQPEGADYYVQVSQESLPATSLFAEAARRVGLSATLAGSTDHSVTYAGADAEVVALATKFGARVSRDSSGVQVEFPPTHPLNTQFHEAPFGGQ